MDALLGALAGARDQRPVEADADRGRDGRRAGGDRRRGDRRGAPAAERDRRPRGRAAAAAGDRVDAARGAWCAARATRRVPSRGAHRSLPPTRRDHPHRPRRRGRPPIARARAWARRHPEIDPRLLLDIADGSLRRSQTGRTCLNALNKVPLDAWPLALSDRALRRRATCEMLRGNCDEGTPPAELLDGADGSRAALLGELPGGVAADDRGSPARGGRAGRRGALRGQYTGPAPRAEAGAAARDRVDRRSRRASATGHASHACGRRLAALARAYQVLAESFLVGRDCPDGAALDVMRSQVKFQSPEPDGGDPALRCRSERVFAAYRSCSYFGEAAERRCLARVQAARKRRRRGVARPRALAARHSNGVSEAGVMLHRYVTGLRLGLGRHRKLGGLQLIELLLAQPRPVVVPGLLGGGGEAGAKALHGLLFDLLGLVFQGLAVEIARVIPPLIGLGQVLGDVRRVQLAGEVLVQLTDARGGGDRPLRLS